MSETIASSAASEQNVPRGILLLLCGLPAAGKSTLAQWMLDNAEHLLAALRPPRGSLTVYHLSFDSVMHKLKQRQGVTRFDPEVWHDARELILRATREHFVSEGTSDASAVSDTIRELGRSRTVHGSSGDASDASGVDLLILDDNMHYRSMRRSYFQIARSAGLGFCTVCLPVDVEQAIERDSERLADAHVGAGTIHLMATTLEWPKPEQHSWERHTATLLQLQEHDELLRMLSEASAEPVCTPQDEAARAAEIAASVAQTAESAQHQLDLRLRKVVSSRMASHEVQAMPAPTRAALAKMLSEHRRVALASCKKRSALDSVHLEVDNVVDSLEHGFNLCVLHCIQEYTSSPGH